MHLAALGLVVCASVLHALWNMLAKRSGGGPLFVWAYSAVTALIYLPIVAWVLASSPVVWTWAAIGLVLISGVLHLGYSLALQGGYRRADLSVVYPVARGTGPILSVAGAVLILGEPVTFGLVAGAGLIVAGIFVIGLSGRSGKGPLAPGLLWGGLTGLFIAAYTVNDGSAVKVLLVPPLLLDYFANIVRLSMLTPLALRRRAAFVEELAGWRLNAVGIGILAPIPYILSLYAMKLAPLSVIAPARELSMMMGVVLGRVLLNEPAVGARLAGAGLILMGIVALFFA